MNPHKGPMSIHCTGLRNRGLNCHAQSTQHRLREQSKKPSWITVT
jgi:hypothetical protein